MACLDHALTIACMLMLCSTATGAQMLPDSLRNKLMLARTDSARARTLLDIGESIESVDPAASQRLYRQALEISRTIKNDRLILSSLVDLGISGIEQNRMDSALHYFSLADPVARQINDTGKIAAVLVNTGNVYIHENNRVNALNYYLQAARLLESASDRSRLAGLYSNLTSLFQKQGQLDKSLEYGDKAFALAQKFNDHYTAANALLNLSVTYSDLNDFENEFAALNKALVFAKQNEDLEQIVAVYNNLGDFHYRQMRFRPALQNYQQSYDIAQQMGNLYHLCTAATMVAHVDYKLHRNAQALHYILEAEALANQVGARADFEEIYKTRAEIEHRNGHFRQAYDYLSKSSTLSDSLFKIESSKTIAEMEAKYQNELKLKTIEQLEQERSLQELSLHQKSIFNDVLLASITTILAIGFLVYRNFKHKHQLSRNREQLHNQRIRELEQERKLIAYNALLKGQEEERSRMARDLHDGLGGMLSGVRLSLGAMKGNILLTEENTRLFTTALGQLDNSIGEMRRVAHNMMPEALVRLGLRHAIHDYCDGLTESAQLVFNVQLHGMDTRLDAASEIVLYRIVQELLNNVVKHSRATEVLVQIMHHDTSLSITIEDNGIGFDARHGDFKKGAGLANVRSRVDYLKGHVDIQSVPGSGTSVHIECIIPDT